MKILQDHKLICMKEYCIRDSVREMLFCKMNNSSFHNQSEKSRFFSKPNFTDLYDSLCIFGTSALVTTYIP